MRKYLVRDSVEETRNALLDHEADELVRAGKYERTGDRKGYRSGHYERNFGTTSGEVKLRVPKLKGIQFETAIIERYKRRECSVEETLIEMYLVGVSVRRVEDITELGAQRSPLAPSAISTRRRTTVTPKTKMKQVTLMLKAIHAQESKEASQEKAASIAAKLREMKLLSAAKKVEESVGETLTYMDFPTEHWSRIRTNNLTERVNREIRRRTRAIGAFPDGNSALMLVCARLRHVAASEWDSKRYMDMEHLFKMEIEQPADEENPYI